MLLGLKKSSDFKKVAQSRIHCKNKSIIAQCSLRDTGSFISVPLRVGFTASRKVGNAVKRNKAKRRLRELARHHLPLLVKISQPLDFVFIASKSTPFIPFSQLSEDFHFSVKFCLSRLKEASLNFRSKE
jgi:ribonuclease P protein component